MTGREKEPPETEATLVTMARYSGHGLTFALSVGLFLLAGWWLDGRLGTTPLLTIVGAMVGAAAGFYSMLQHLLFFPREAEERKRVEAAGGSKDESAGASDPRPDAGPRTEDRD